MTAIATWASSRRSLLSGLVFACALVALTSIPDGPHRQAAEIVLVGFQLAVVFLLVVGRHWLTALICVVLAAATISRF